MSLRRIWSEWSGWLFVLPYLILFAAFIVTPLQTLMSTGQAAGWNKAWTLF